MFNWMLYKNGVLRKMTPVEDGEVPTVWFTIRNYQGNIDKEPLYKYENGEIIRVEKMANKCVSCSRYRGSEFCNYKEEPEFRKRDILYSIPDQSGVDEEQEIDPFICFLCHSSYPNHLKSCPLYNLH